jgi:O-antigen/teichoic acid export membrane protein
MCHLRTPTTSSTTFSKGRSLFGTFRWRLPTGAGTVRANLVAAGIAEAVARLSQLAALSIMGRALQPAGMGVIGTAWAIYQLALPFAQGAPDIVGTRDIARGGDCRAAMVDVTAIKLVIALLSSAVIALSAAYVARTDRTTGLQILLQAPLLLVTVLNGAWVFRGMRTFGRFALIRILSALALLACLGIGLALARTPWVVAASETAAGLLAAVAAAFMIGQGGVMEIVRGVAGRLRRLPGGDFKRIAQLGLGAFAAALTWSCPLLAARGFMGIADQGLLAAALRLIVAIAAIYQLGLQVCYPMLAHRFATATDAARALTGALVVYAAAASIPVAVLLALLSKMVVIPLLGRHFAGSATAVTLLAPILVPVAVGSVFGYAMLADGRYRAYIVLSLATALSALAACVGAFALVPTPSGSVALVAVQAVSALAGGVIAGRYGLVGTADISWRVMTPRHIRGVLGQR